MLHFKHYYILIFIFPLGILIRFLYFPDDVYFSFDQARDSYTALEILKGDFKIIGPPSAASDKLFAGPLAYYFYALVYFLSDKNPESLSAFMRLYNCFGVILTFLIGSVIFNRATGLIAAGIFAVSFEQSQLALFTSHQPMAVVAVLIFYLGLSLLIFQPRKVGPWVASLIALGLGLSIQFHYTYVLLAPILLLLILFFRKNFPQIKIKILLISLGILLLTISSYFFAEAKFGFRQTTGLVNAAQNILYSGQSSSFNLGFAGFILKRFIHDNFLSIGNSIGVFCLMVIFLSLEKEVRGKVIFLGLWLLGGLIPYILTSSPSYYYGAGGSVSLILAAAYLIYKLKQRLPLLAFLVIFIILASNLGLITKQNRQGPNSDIIIQPGMLVSNQKKALDYIYVAAQNAPFAVNGLTIPLSVNTTWSYLFEWYGLQKYGYLPTWIGPVAAGFPGNLPVGNDRGGLPKKRFLIMEPDVGIRAHDKQTFFKEEGYFTKVVEEKNFGTIKVQIRDEI